MVQMLTHVTRVTRFETDNLYTTGTQPHFPALEKRLIQA